MQVKGDTMSYYHTPTGVERSPGRLETKLSDGKQLGPPDTGWDDTLAALCGFVPIIDTARPADTASVTYDRSIGLPAGLPTVVWTQRPKTAGELAADTAQTVRADIESRVNAYLAAADTFLALGAPVQADVLAQCRRNTRAIIGILRQARTALLVPSTDV
jgi:hypothetical protein